MAVHIGEISTSVEVVDPRALLSHAVLEQIVAAVLQRLDERDRDECSRAGERDLRSVVERQRSKGG